MIGGSPRLDRLERRVARLEDLLRQLALVFGVAGVDLEIARSDEPEPPAAEASTAIVDHRRKR